MSSIMEQESTGVGFHPEFDKLARHFDKRSRESMVETSKLTKEIMGQRLALGDYHLPVKLGAPVISVDGEISGGNVSDYERAGFLGYYVGMKQVNDSLVRVYFTTKKGFYYEGTKNVRQAKDFIPHPLAKEGYFIPTRDGYKVLDNGEILLVSRVGLFSQVDGYELSERRLKKLIRERQRGYHYQQLHEEAQLKLEGLQERHDGTWMRLADATTKLRKLEAIQTRLAKAKEVANGVAENLSAKAQYSQDVLEHSRRQLKVEVSKYSRSINDILLLVERNQLDEGMRGLMSEHPSLNAEFDRQMVEKWRRENIITETQEQHLMRKLGEYERRLKDIEERGLDEERSGHTTEGTLGNQTPDYGFESDDSPEGLGTGQGQDDGTKGHGKLSELASKGKEKLDKTYNALSDLVRRRGRDEQEASDGSEEENPDGEDTSE